MRIFKLLIILSLISANNLWAQNNGQNNLMSKDYNLGTYQCTRLSEEEINKINQSIRTILAENFTQRTGLLAGNDNQEPAKTKTFDAWQAASIFTNNPKLRLVLTEKHKNYDEIRYNQNWKNSPYSKIQPEEISSIINENFQKIRKTLKRNPIYISNHIGANCGQLGTILMGIAAFQGLFELAAAAIPYAATASEYSVLSGFVSFFPKEIATSTPIFMATVGKAKYVGSSVGLAFQLYGSGVFQTVAEDIFGVFDNSTNSLGAQKDLHIALKQEFDLAKQIQEIKNNQNLNPAQKQKRIDIRYKEAIIKIYALDYINTYLSYSEKPEKYLWAILDLTTLLQNRGSITFEGYYGRTIEIEAMPRLIERTPEMKESLEKIMIDIIDGFKIKAYGNFLQNQIEKQALKNIENSEFNLN